MPPVQHGAAATDAWHGLRSVAGNRGDYVPHGFCSSFRDWSGKVSSFPRDVAEMALAHVVENKVEAAYRRGDLFAKRRKMMQEWADLCEQATSRGDTAQQARQQAEAIKRHRADCGVYGASSGGEGRSCGVRAGTEGAALTGATEPGLPELAEAVWQPRTSYSTPTGSRSPAIGQQLCLSIVSVAEA